MTCLERYGKRFNCERGTYEIGKHHLQRNMKNLDDLDNPEKMEQLRQMLWVDVSKHFGLSECSHASVYNLMRKYGYSFPKRYGTSGLEQEVANFVKSITTSEVITNTKSVITPYELDIYIPEFKLAIEVDGVYYHSAGSKAEEKPTRHLDKTNMCEHQGITLLHIFENEWVEKREIWESVIRTKLGLNKKIYARQTVMRDVPLNEAKRFCEDNHLQGYAPCSRAVGLYTSDDKLVIIATFGPSRYNKKVETELIRMCSLKNLTVVGGASKLLKNETFISYANRRWSCGNVYNKLGMRYVGTSAPCYWYVDRGFLHHRSAFMKHKLSKKLNTFDPNLTEVENCYANGLRRIWDCGNHIFVKEVTK